jgi:hypothetical protein
MSETNKLQTQSNEKVANEVGAPSTEKKAEGEKKKLPQLGALEDDDEFEVCSSSFPFWVTLIFRTFQQLVCCFNCSSEVEECSGEIELTDS